MALTPDPVPGRDPDRDRDRDSREAPPPPEAVPAGVVLYIEDNAVNALIVEQYLARWPGIRLVLARDGRSGIAQAQAWRPDLVLLDMGLPDLAGVDVLRALVATVGGSAPPVVVVSASVMPDEVALGLANGAADYWSKPLDLHVFGRKVRELLLRSSSSRRRRPAGGTASARSAMDADVDGNVGTAASSISDAGADAEAGAGAGRRGN